VVDHDWAKSIYFKDPNGVQLDTAAHPQPDADDARMQERPNLDPPVGADGCRQSDAVESAKAG